MNPDPKDLIAVHTLSLSPDYVLEWGFWDACRELFQNSIDQQTCNLDSHVIFTYAPEPSSLTIGATHCNLEPRTLLMGVTDKTGDRSTIGQFGEGYKLALLVLTRLSFSVEVRTGNQLWIPSFVYSEEYQSHVLTVSRYRTDIDNTGVTFSITDVSMNQYSLLCENFLWNEPLNRILREDFHKGRVYVGGLFVEKIDDLQYGYNFSPDRLKLGRDRNIAPYFETTYEASRLWDASGDHEALYKNLREGHADTQYVRVETRTANQYVLDSYLTESPDCVPVSTDKEARLHMNAGRKVRRVSRVLQDALRRLHDFACEHEDTPAQVMEQFQHDYQAYLMASGRNRLESLVQMSRHWTGPTTALEPEGDPE